MFLPSQSFVCTALVSLSDCLSSNSVSVGILPSIGRTANLLPSLSLSLSLPLPLSPCLHDCCSPFLSCCVHTVLLSLIVDVFVRPLTSGAAQEIINKIFPITLPWHLPVPQWFSEGHLGFEVRPCNACLVDAYQYQLITADSQLSLHDGMLHTVFTCFSLYSQ